MNGTSVKHVRNSKAAEQARELTLAREAIALVACGASRRVLVTGIRHGHEIVGLARDWAVEHGALVNVECDDVNGYSDLAIEAMDSDGRRPL